MPLTLNPRLWASPELTHHSGLCYTPDWSGAAMGAGVHDGHNPEAGQPGEETAGSFGTDLDVGQDLCPKMCTQPWKSKCEKQLKCPTR